VNSLAQEQTGSPLPSLLFFLVLLVGLYLLLIRPQRARAKKLAAVRSRLEPGLRVITTAGLHAEVVAIDDDTVVLEIAPGVRATFAAQAVVRVLDQPGDDDEAADTDTDADDEADPAEQTEQAEHGAPPPGDRPPA
jgi:preprotein translocase subunit YajC